jgi:hypothetical protein
MSQYGSDPWAGYGQQPQQPYQQPQQFQQPYQQPQQFQQPYQQPQQYAPAPPPPPVPSGPAGTLDDFYGQPSGGGGPSISWKDAQPGSQIVGRVARDVNDSDVRQQTDMRTQQPKYYRDGRPMLCLVIPLEVQPDQRFPDGRASLWVRGQMRDELTRAMKASGVDGAPKEGDVFSVTLTGRRPTGQGMNPANEFRIEYQPARVPQAQAPQAQAPQAQAPQSQPSAPAPQQFAQAPQAPQAPQQFAQAPQQPQQFAQAPQVPAPQSQPSAPAPQNGNGQQLSPEQLELLARIKG